MYDKLQQILFGKQVVLDLYALIATDRYYYHSIQGLLWWIWLNELLRSQYLLFHFKSSFLLVWRAVYQSLDLLSSLVDSLDEFVLGGKLTFLPSHTTYPPCLHALCLSGQHPSSPLRSLMWLREAIRAIKLRIDSLQAAVSPSPYVD